MQRSCFHAQAYKHKRDCSINPSVLPVPRQVLDTLVLPYCGFPLHCHAMGQGHGPMPMRPGAGAAEGQAHVLGPGAMTLQYKGKKQQVTGHSIKNTVEQPPGCAYKPTSNYAHRIKCIDLVDPVCLFFSLSFLLTLSLYIQYICIYTGIYIYIYI